MGLGMGGVPVNQGTRTMRLPHLAVHDFLKGTVVFRVLCSPGEDRGPGNALTQPSCLVPGATWVAWISAVR